MRVLVTGGAGFIGQHLVPRLLKAGHHVTVYDQVMHTNVEAAGQVFVRADLFDNQRLCEAMDGKDVVYHLAGHASVRDSETRIQLEQNVLATHRVLEAMRETHVPQIVFSSSSAVYGYTEVFPTPERCPWPMQTTVYGAAKASSEAMISAYAYSFGMRATIFRFAPILGEGYRRGHLWDFWNALKQHPTYIEIQGDGQQRRSFVYVGDVVEAVMLAGQVFEPVRVFNVGHIESCTIEQSLNWLCELMRVKPDRSYSIESRIGDKPLTILDCSRMHDLGWSPKVSIKEAVRRTVGSFDA